MGSLRKRGGKWQLRYYRDGKRMEESTGLSDRAPALRLLKVREADVAKGIPVSPASGRYTFEQAAMNIEREYSANGRKSAASLNRRLRLHLLPAFGGRRMSTITTSDVREYTHKRLAEGARNATINRELAVLKRMFSLAIKDGTLPFLPHIPMLKENNVRTGFFEDEQFEAVRAHLPIELRTMVSLAYLTGWRIPSEVLTLQWRQVDLVAGVVRLEPGATKNDDARTFPFDEIPKLRELIEEQRAMTDDVEKATGRIIRGCFTAWANRSVATRRRGRPHARPRAVLAVYRMTSAAPQCGTCLELVCRTPSQ